MSARLYLKPELWVPAMGCPPTKVKPYSAAMGKQASHTFCLMPERSITTQFLDSMGATRRSWSITPWG